MCVRGSISVWVCVFVFVSTVTVCSEHPENCRIGAGLKEVKENVYMKPTFTLLFVCGCVYLCVHENRHITSWPLNIRDKHYINMNEKLHRQINIRLAFYGVARQKMYFPFESFQQNPLP